MTAITRFEDIESWKTARQLTNSVYVHTNLTGFNRDFGLRDQIRRGSVSVMSNITEEQFKDTYAMAETCARQIAKFIKYLEANPRPRRISDDSADYEV